jgi:hypothetical protein
MRVFDLSHPPELVSGDELQVLFLSDVSGHGKDYPLFEFCGVQQAPSAFSVSFHLIPHFAIVEDGALFKDKLWADLL